MFDIKGVFLLLPILASLGYVAGEDLSDYQVKQLCKGKDMEILPYPGEPSKFIVCLSNQAQVGVCRMEQDPDNADAQKQTCFDERKQSCSLAACPEAKPETDYDKFVKKYCQDDSNWLERLPAQECESYYICLGSSNDPLKQSCPEGMHFSRVTKTCQSPLQASCQSLDAMCQGKHTGYRFASNNCYDFYECRLGKPTARSCQYGEHYDVATKRCIAAEQSKCVDDTARQPVCTANDNGLYFKHPKCNHFYVCVNTVPLEAQCPQDYFFDEKNQLCKRDTHGVCSA